jgi:high-affinity nickel-transport protein
MSFVDSLDSVLMLYAYASPSRSTPEGKIGLFQSTKIELDEEADRLVLEETHPDPTAEIVEDDIVIREDSAPIDKTKDSKSQVMDSLPVLPMLAMNEASGSQNGPDTQAIDTKKQVISSLSVTLTALSIIVALR